MRTPKLRSTSSTKPISRPPARSASTRQARSWASRKADRAARATAGGQGRAQAVRLAGEVVGAGRRLGRDPRRVRGVAEMGVEHPGHDPVQAQREADIGPREPVETRAPRPVDVRVRDHRTRLRRVAAGGLVRREPGLDTTGGCRGPRRTATECPAGRGMRGGRDRRITRSSHSSRSRNCQSLDGGSELEMACSGRLAFSPSAAPSVGLEAIRRGPRIPADANERNWSTGC